MPKKLLEPIIVLLDRTVANWKIPFIKRKIDKSKAFEIMNEFYLRKPSGVYIGFVRSNWTGSTFLIRLGQWLRSGAPKVWARFTHVFILVKDDNENIYTIEAVNEGVIKTTLIKSICERDDLVIKRVSKKHFSIGMKHEFEKYIEEVIERDAAKNIPYDEKHVLTDPLSVDCSELIYHGLVKVGLKNEINTVKRAGEISWSPLECYESKLFEVEYDIQ